MVSLGNSSGGHVVVRDSLSPIIIFNASYESAISLPRLFYHRRDVAQPH